MPMDPLPETKSLEEPFRKYAWDYFALHADHRLRAFHFYILLSTTVLGGFGLLLRNGELHKWMSGIGLLLVFLSFVFWKLDNRTRQLIKLGEEALKYLDGEYKLPLEGGKPHPLCLFQREAAESAMLRLWPLWFGHFSYARCFRWMFAMFSVVGLVIVLVSLFFGAA